MTRSEDDRRQMETIGRNITRLLESREMSQNDLAKILGVTESAVSRWMKAHNAPSMGNVQRMADYFGVQMSDILEDDPEPSFLDPDRRYLLDQLHTMTDDQVKQLSALWDVINRESHDQ